MANTRTLKWTFAEDEVIIDYHTSYLNQAFEKKLLGFKTNQEKTKKKEKVKKKKVN